ncbi:hypothetical protein HOY80DRAFT_1007883 [Tuber brumale]|nr:hypothetical protein HOY80DRAFT_1007883 [Tuber brumale]
MARPPCPKPMPREKGFKCQQSTLSFPASSSSNPKTQYSSQPAPTSHTLSPLETLLSQPIPFVKTQTISGALAECQTVFSLGYFGKEMGRKRCLVSVEGKAIKKMRRDSSTKDVDDRDPSGDEVLGQSQPVREWRVVGEGSVGKTASETPARKIKLLHSRKTTVPLKDRKNEPNKELANTTPKKSTASGGTLVKPIPGSPKEVIKKNGLKKVSHLLEPGVQNGPYTGSAVLLPDGTTAPGMATLERESTSKGQFRNLKLNTGSVANNSGKTIVSGTSDLNRKSEALSERSSGKCPDKLRVKGLMNTSFFCYRNSVLQLLASSTVFVEEITRHINEKCKYLIPISPLLGMSNRFKVNVVLIVFPAHLENSSRTILFLPGGNGL